MSSFYEGSDPQVDYDGAAQAVALAKAWAIKLDGPVDGSDYSAEYNAQLAADSANASATSATNAKASEDAAAASADRLDSLLLGDLVNVSQDVPQDAAVLTWDEAQQLWVPSLVVPPAASQALLDKIVAFEAKLRAIGVIS